ncbi:MAG: lyase family protein [Acidilobaceae archaeon]
MYRRILLGPINESILDYISSLEEDKLIVCEVLEVLEAHVNELKDSNSIPPHVANEIISEIRILKSDPSPLFSTSSEDVHESIELYMRNKLGDKAGYLALGRSRNDHVAAALRLKLSRLVLEELRVLISLRRSLLSMAKNYLDTLIPLYTHFYPAQLSTLAHYLLYIDEMLSTYVEAILKVLELTFKSPLGSGPVAGVMTPINRERLASILFGGKLVYNTLYASSSRDFMLLLLAINASLMTSISRIVEDLILLSTPYIGFFILPSEHLSTSSIMPHKRNPVTLEVARAKAGEAIGNFVVVASILKGLPSGYNLDLQEANIYAIRALSDTINTLNMLNDIIAKLRVNTEAMARDIYTYPILAPDIVELVALKTGRPFRIIYEEIAILIGECRDTREFYTKVSEKYGISIEPLNFIERPVSGSPSISSTIKYIEESEGSLGVLELKLESINAMLPRGCYK